MKRLLDKIAEYITDNETIGAYLFLFIFVTRIFLDLVIEKKFGLGEEWQHYIFAFYKYNYVIIVGYMFIYEIFYLYRFHKFHFTKIQWTGILYAFVAIIATYAYLKDQLAYDYFTKLSLGEMIMTSVFMFDVGRKLNPQNFDKLLVICSKFFLLLTFLINIASLTVLVLDWKENIILLGRTITMPFHYYKPASLLGVFPYAGFYYNTSITGPCCSLGIFLLIWLLKAKRINAASFVILLVTNIYCLFLSGNRTGEIGLIAFLFCLFTETINRHIISKKKKGLIYSITLLLMLFSTIYLLFKKKDITTILNTFLTNPFLALDNLSSARMQIVVSVMNIIKQRPLLGNGWNSKIPIGSGDSIKYFPYAHNVYLGVLAWTGCLGFVIILVFSKYVINALKHSVNRLNKGNKCIFYIIIGIFIQCQFENGIFGDWNHAYTYLFWIILGFGTHCSDTDLTKPLTR